MQAGTESPERSTAAAASGGEDLVEASRRGNLRAFEQIIERHQRAVYAVAYAGVRDRARADDVTQDTFVLAWRRLDELRDTDRLGAWLCGIARNLARDARRRMQRESLGEVAEPVDPATPLQALADAETERLIAAGLESVPEVYREPLVMFYFQDRSVEDVARTLGISPATTNKRLSRARRYLADRVAAIVEHGLVRRGPSPALAGGVLGAIVLGVGSASHVDASPLKGSTMSKLLVAALVTTTVAAGGVIVAHALRGGDAHAKPDAKSAPAAAHAGEHCLADLVKAATGKSHAPDGAGAPAIRASATPSLAGSSSGTAAMLVADCAAVGRHLAELEADATHGPEHRPDEATCEKCAGHYTAMCESQGWSATRRACSLAAPDLINAHLCAGSQQASTAAPTAPELQCNVLGEHIATVVRAAGLYPDVTDMAQQVDAACQLGGWPTELRTCFAAAGTVPALQACIAPDLQP